MSSFGMFDRFSKGAVVRVPDAADRGFDAYVGQTLSGSNGQILPAAVGRVGRSAFLSRPSIMQSVLESTACLGRPQDPRAYDAISKDVDDRAVETPPVQVTMVRGYINNAQPRGCAGDAVRWA